MWMKRVTLGLNYRLLFGAFSSTSGDPPIAFQESNLATNSSTEFKTV